MNEHDLEREVYKTFNREDSAETTPISDLQYNDNRSTKVIIQRKPTKEGKGTTIQLAK